MKKSQRCLAAALALTSFAVQAQSVEFKNIYSLGDSLSDVGVFSNAVIGGAALQGVTLPNIQYRFTDNNPDGSSKVWVENLAGHLGLSLNANRINPVIVGGGAFAEGGARVSNPVGIGYAPQNQITTIPLTTQVDRLLQMKPILDEGDLIFLWAGANDGFVQFATIAGGGNPLDSLGAMAGEATVVAQQVSRLREAGAKFVVVALLPDLANTPFGALVTQANAQGGQLLSALSSAFNTAALSAVPEAGAVVVDVNKLLSDVIANPTRYGFNANALGMTACGVNPSRTGPDDFYNSSLQCLGTNPGQYVFADGVHPSAKAHELFGLFAYSGLQAIAQAGALVVAPMVAIRQHAQSLEGRLNIGALADVQGQVRTEGDVQVYLSPEAGHFDVPASQVEPAVKANTVKTAFGVDRMVSRNALVGLALSYSKGETTFGGQKGRLNTTDTLGVAYTTVALSENWYVNASLAYGEIDHTDFTRQLVLPTTTISTHSAPQGTYRSVRVGAGWTGDWAGGQGGPYLSLTREKTAIKGFTESESPMSLSFGDLSYRAHRLALGGSWVQSKPLGQWRFFGRAAIERDLESQDLTISMGPTASSLGVVEVPRPQRTTWNASLGLALPQVDRGVWTLQLGLGGPQNKLEAYTLGASYRRQF